ncbi:hypothetical protein [Photobacterium indicum]|uniref:hypothetical protein n=1 Tax=Photobacterium indicum TaxID=81447 RepID=UPI001FE87FCA|nr:hypothetical protein [Photobacterium indicum]
MAMNVDSSLSVFCKALQKNTNTFEFIDGKGLPSPPLTVLEWNVVCHDRFVDEYMVFSIIACSCICHRIFILVEGKKEMVNVHFYGRYASFCSVVRYFAI